MRAARHLLLDVLTPERLSRAEFDEFVHYAGLAVEPSDAMAYGPDADERARVDYPPFLTRPVIGRPPMHDAPIVSRPRCGARSFPEKEARAVGKRAALRGAP